MSSSDLPSAARAPATTLPVSGSITSPVHHWWPPARPRRESGTSPGTVTVRAGLSARSRVFDPTPGLRVDFERSDEQRIAVGQRRAARAEKRSQPDTPARMTAAIAIGTAHRPQSTVSRASLAPARPAAGRGFEFELGVMPARGRSRARPPSVPQRRVDGEELLDDRFQLFRDRGVHRPRRHDDAVHDLHHDVREVVAVERRGGRSPSRRARCRAKTGPSARRARRHAPAPATCIARSRSPCRSGQVQGARSDKRRHQRRLEWLARCDQHRLPWRRQPRRWPAAPGRIQHLDVIPVGDEQVGRLDVAMDDAPPVSGVERIGDLARESRSLARRHRASSISSRRPPSSRSIAMKAWPRAPRVRGWCRCAGVCSAEARRASRRIGRATLRGRARCAAS